MSAHHRAVPNLLSIAGSDPSGGAGIQADLKTFAALGCHGMSVITALTAQNTQRIGTIHLPPATFVTEQIAMIFADIGVDAVKIGMLGSAEIVESVAAALAAVRNTPIVLDPVLAASAGATLGHEDVVAAMRRLLFPVATIVTPNLIEAAQLADAAVPTSPGEIESLAHKLRSEGGAAWLIKGGHAEGPTSEDFFLDDAHACWLSAPRIVTKNTHGTGCTLSSAIAAYLAKGASLLDAARQAKAFLGAALGTADRLDVGRGPGPLDHFFDRR